MESEKSTRRNHRVSNTRHGSNMYLAISNAISARCNGLNLGASNHRRNVCHRQGKGDETLKRHTGIGKVTEMVGFTRNLKTTAARREIESDVEEGDTVTIYDNLTGTVIRKLNCSAVVEIDRERTVVSLDYIKKATPSA